MKKIMALSALLLSLCFIQAPVSFAGEGWSKGCLKFEKTIHKLNLTAQQKAQIKTIKADTKAKLKPIHEKMKAVRYDINQAFAEGVPGEFKLHSYVNEQKDLVGSAMKIRLDERVQIYKILTDAQRSKLTKLINEWKIKHSN